jgi:hypothetical protein
MVLKSWKTLENGRHFRKLEIEYEPLSSGTGPRLTAEGARNSVLWEEGIRRKYERIEETGSGDVGRRGVGLV